MSKLDLKEILRNVLIANNILEEKFSLDGYKDEAYCIEKITEGYKVYEALGEKKDGIKIHTRLLYACYDIIYRVCPIMQDIPKIKSNFADNVILEALEILEIED